MKCKSNKQRLKSLEFDFPEPQECTKCAMNPNMVNNFEPGFYKIDLSGIVGSDIDMEFGDSGKIWFTGKLKKINTYTFENINGSYYNKCRVREGHWHAWTGGKDCPLPEGLIVSVMERDGVYLKRVIYETRKWNWVSLGMDDIIAFRVDGVREGYTYG